MAAAQNFRDAANLAVGQNPAADVQIRTRPGRATARARDPDISMDLAYGEPQVERYPPLVRLAIIGGGSALFWAAVVLAAKNAFHA